MLSEGWMPCKTPHWGPLSPLFPTVSFLTTAEVEVDKKCCIDENVLLCKVIRWLKNYHTKPKKWRWKAWWEHCDVRPGVFVFKAGRALKSFLFSVVNGFGCLLLVFFLLFICKMSGDKNLKNTCVVHWHDIVKTLFLLQNFASTARQIFDLLSFSSCCSAHHPSNQNLCCVPTSGND